MPKQGSAYVHQQSHLAEGGPVEDDAQIMDMVVDELMEAFEKKDKALLMDALRALVLHIQDEDQEQDQGEIS